MIVGKALSYLLMSVLISSPVLADASNPTAGITTDELYRTYPVHWVSVEQIGNSLEGKPPMVVGFDIDDTVLFSSPCFYHGQQKYSPGNNDYLENPKFWKEVNGGCDVYSLPKAIAFELIEFHKKRGDTILFITGRTKSDGETLTKLIKETFDLNEMRQVVFTAGSETKTAFLKDSDVSIYYGDSDGDMKAAKAAGARPIRVLRPPNSTYKPLPKNGAFDEEVIVDSAW